MEIKIKVNTDTHGFTMEPTNKETFEWFINQFPAYMGAYYGAFLDKIGQMEDLTTVRDVGTKCMEFTQACLGELNPRKGGEIIDVEAKEVEEDPNRRVLMPKMPSCGESDCERRPDGRVYNH